ncbi:30S ribosome-binding factor RbfA [Atopobium deltae]|uniref:Ribosome-binding factor A n=1 Tax=Atopobium deltae TaxID=1393034 RepID=A0A133XSE7_9ACTN|nr:30S ribosome-binding factor RbfA [Atopobium deltae]KXB33864.1 ribosome-binding factor A [Atopobium deltae]
MKQNQASRRINEQAREKLASILLLEISDPDLAMVTITAVEVSVDRSFMRVFVSCDSSQYERTMAAFDRAKGRIRSLLGRSLAWRVTPQLRFEIDRTTDEAERIAQALEQVPPTLGVPKDEDGYPLDNVDNPAGDGADGFAGGAAEKDAASGLADNSADSVKEDA